MSDFTCKGCGNRHPGCHATYEKYIAEKAKWDAARAEYRKIKQINDGLDHQLINTMYKNKKRRGKQKPSYMGGQ